ncbi:MAG: hypothetical protein EHM34_05745 [Nitrosopumilales archaeon]|nr:MAG: hypothetical protein EHM34_05745 [Nitrosopumilales archaeon]
MKRRNGFVSNSSSTSFVINTAEMPEDLKSMIFRLRDRSDDSSRCTGIITDLKGWADMVYEDDYDDVDGNTVRSYAKNPDVVMIRESDEEMGGSFSDYGFCQEDIKKYVIYEFEFH